MEDQLKNQSLIIPIQEVQRYNRADFEAIADQRGPTIDIVQIYDAHQAALIHLTPGAQKTILVSGQKLRKSLKGMTKKIEYETFSVYGPMETIAPSQLNMNRFTAIAMIKATIDGTTVPSAISTLLPASIQTLLGPHCRLVSTGVQFLAAAYVKGGEIRTNADIIRFRTTMGSNGMGVLWICANCVDWVAYCRNKSKTTKVGVTFEQFCMNVTQEEKGTAMAMCSNMGAIDMTGFNFSDEDIKFMNQAYACQGFVGRASGNGVTVMNINKTVASMKKQ